MNFLVIDGAQDKINFFSYFNNNSYNKSFQFSKNNNEKFSILLFSFLNENNINLNEKWTILKKIRDNCNISIEEKRAEKIIGSSLEAKIEVKLKSKLYEIAKNIDFAELCITSEAQISEDQKISEDISVITFKAEGEKCPVCWKIKKGKCERHGI